MNLRYVDCRFDYLVKHAVAPWGRNFPKHFWDRHRRVVHQKVHALVGDGRTDQLLRSLPVADIEE